MCIRDRHRGDGSIAEWNYTSVLFKDGDSMPDAWELWWLGSDVTDTGDPDGDGLDNATEYANGTHPGLLDTDGDGYPDSADTKPLDPLSGGGI